MTDTTETTETAHAFETVDDLMAFWKMAAENDPELKEKLMKHGLIEDPLNGFRASRTRGTSLPHGALDKHAQQRLAGMIASISPQDFSRVLDAGFLHIVLPLAKTPTSNADFVEILEELGIKAVPKENAA